MCSKEKSKKICLECCEKGNKFALGLKYFYGFETQIGNHEKSFQIFSEIIKNDKNFEKINYMIHGHAFFKDETIKTTTEYFPCGDLREINEITNAVGSRNVEWFLLNLKNHGFIIATNTLENMEKLVDLYKLEIKPFRQIK